MSFKIWQFSNATVVQPKISDTGQSVLNSAGENLNLMEIPGENSGSDTVFYNTTVLEQSVGELTVVTVSEHKKDVVKYVPKNSVDHPELRDLTVEQYSGLTGTFQALYKQQEPETFTEIVEEVVTTETVPYELDWDFLYGRRFVSWLHSVVVPRRMIADNRSMGNSTPRVTPRLHRNLPLTLDGNDLMAVLSSKNTSIVQKERFGALVTIPVPGSFMAGNVKVKFFSETWDRKFTKRLDKKSNGHPYADRRGRMVPDYPATVGEAEITVNEIETWWNSINGNTLTDEQKAQVLDDFMVCLCKVAKKDGTK